MRIYYIMGFLSLAMGLDLYNLHSPKTIEIQARIFLKVEETVCIEEIELKDEPIEFILENVEEEFGKKLKLNDLNRFREQTEIEGTTKELNSYVKRFLPTALVEQSRYGIPASVKFAQGLLESNIGKSELCKKANNHFGIKDFSGKGLKFKDDSAKDKFKIFSSSWESWRAHSILLTKKGARYEPLFKKEFNKAAFLKYKDLIGRNYKSNGSYYYGKDPNFQHKLELLKKNWHIPYKRFAYGLDILGYATSNRYAESLIKLIEKNNLTKFDNLEVIF